MNIQTAIIELSNHYGAHNYSPLNVVLKKGEGIWLWDMDGNKYVDCLSAYSAVNQGHCHPRIIGALCEQAQELTLTSRAFHNEKMGLFLQTLCQMAEMEMALPMNTGAEAVETAIKTIRLWAHKVKGIARDQAEIIVCRDNFHGRTISTVSMSSEQAYRDGFGPFTPGFKIVEFASIEALADAVNERTAAILIEPIQGEAGIRIPPDAYLAGVQQLCAEHELLFALDEIQTGFGRTGKLFCYQHEAGVKPDILIVGKALSGGVYPISAVLSSREILGLFTPGQHGSTFGGNPLAAAVGIAALDVLIDEDLSARSAELGSYLLAQLNRDWGFRDLIEIRGRGLFIGIELSVPVRPHCERLLQEGVLCKETHDNVLRIAPPLVINKKEVDFLLEKLIPVLEPLPAQANVRMAV